ncbi:uncharacterized protein A1O9_09442 [Exophiala aquamarina CBS 119918]|uniref:Uncharacterized protein n=1 Tax=Exophiala aquamarina CBS 119918 TaxID=1182545 RepID=A0A072P393_9EURO|nr:uncharacterized protein A1O9_09442 [Exophiala aquamarina CBS 119918]KEF54276.1 hypothetical protein A1O9_09442 [Exophiala aquamarina CBS 119918]
MDSFISSFQSEFEATNTRTASRGPSATQSTTSGDASATVAATGSAATAFATFTSASGKGASGSITGNPSNTASNAASNTSEGAVTVRENSCNSISCSLALKATIAVPIVVAAIAVALLFFFCARRRKGRAASAAVSKKRPKKASKKWSRHLRAFSFDAELLMGGRFSSSNSIRSRDPSVRSAGDDSRNGAHSAEPSLRSIEKVAPPYRDAISGAQPMNPSPLRHVNPAIAAAADPIPRSVSSATAPSPYRTVAGEADNPPTPISTRNPFADSAPVSPIDGSPFIEPPEDEEAAAGAIRPTMSRGSSLYQSVNADDASDAASI